MQIFVGAPASSVSSHCASQTTTTKDMDDDKVEWSDLPKELLLTIGKSLDTRIDILRFRSVCNSWRSSVPPFHSSSPCFPLKFPDPFPSSRSKKATVFLCQTTLYRLQRQNPSTSDKALLIKVEESSSGNLRLLDPFSTLTNRYEFNSHHGLPKNLNFLNFRILELTKSYTLKCRKYSKYSYVSIRGVNKVVMFPNSAWTNVNDSAVFVIYNDGKLGFGKCGDKNLTLVDDQRFDYDDVIVYKGQFYVVDKLGLVSWIDDSSMKLVPFSPPLCGLGDQKHLVESCGALYVVDRYLQRKRRGRNGPKVVGFKVYKLDEEWGRWDLKESLGDRAFILGRDCSLSVSGRDFLGYRGNCICFTEENQTHVFNLEDRSITDLACCKDSNPSPMFNLGM